MWNEKQTKFSTLGKHRHLNDGQRKRNHRKLRKRSQGVREDTEESGFT